MNTKICIIGLGYVGLPLSLLAAQKGYSVYGYDVNQEYILDLQQGKSHHTDPAIVESLRNLHKSIHFTSDDSVLALADVVVVCVPTPVDKSYLPNLAPLTSATEAIARNLKQGQLIIIESTTFPGTMKEMILPILQKSGKVVGKDYFLAHCPERIDPGNKKYTLSTLPRVVGGITTECTEKAYEFYQSILDAHVLKVSTITTAESTKVVENTFRDVNIALVNELARSFDALGVDIFEVIQGAATKPFAFMPHYPGCGVGGHCIPVDPYYLIERVKANGFNPRFLSLAREINNAMPGYTIQKVTEGLVESGRGFKNSKIVVLGAAYKGGIEDVRESPALHIIEMLKNEGATVDVFDPYVPNHSTVTNITEALQGKDCVVLATDHEAFKNITARQFVQHGIKVVIDGRNCLNKKEITNAGIIYKGIGR
jgi:UDP-N-acetyl-D-glucosamine dehydrogenase